MSNPLKKIERVQKKAFVTEFKKDSGYTNDQIVGLCLMTKNKVSLNGKVNAIVDIQIKAMEEKYAATLKDHDVEVSALSQSEVVEDATLVESVITHG